MIEIIYQVRLLDGQALEKEWVEVTKAEFETPTSDLYGKWERRKLCAIPTYSDLFECLKAHYEVEMDSSVMEIFEQSDDKLNEIAEALKSAGNHKDPVAEFAKEFHTRMFKGTIPLRYLPGYSEET